MATPTSLTQFDVDALFKQACPTKEDTPFFNHCMAIAKERGLTWEEGLEYTIEMRKTK